MGLAARPDATRVAESSRYLALDGLRGIAALVVVVHHCMLINPELAATYLGGTVSGPLGWLVYTPVHLLWAGAEAVTIFFVLSGFVLTLPFTSERAAPSWRSYYPQRIVRLYLPVGASLAFAVLTYVVVDHQVRPGESWWLAAHAAIPTVGRVATDFLLVAGASPTNSVLWSLRWEVLFSLLLPVAVLILARFRRPGLRALLFCACFVLIIALDSIGFSGPRYLLVFGFGVVMAVERQRLQRLGARISRTGWWFLLAVAVVLLLVWWWPTGGQTTAASAISALGAVMILFAFLCDPRTARLGRTWPLLWVGRRSFSLYLVHEPIVVSTGLLLRTGDPLPVLAIAAPVALVVAALFYRFIEHPAHRLARSTGRYFARARPDDRGETDVSGDQSPRMSASQRSLRDPPEG